MNRFTLSSSELASVVFIAKSVSRNSWRTSHTDPFAPLPSDFSTT